MKTAAIIGEFNPFHNGHKLIIEKARRLGADRVITLVSGDYMQRGVPAVTDRHVRAEMALLGGADVVLSYPTRYSTSSAESFASHAVGILERLGCVDMLLFGSESGDLAELSRCADALISETDGYKEALREALRSGLSFPKARAKALPEYAEILRSPNNILGIEYLKALKRSGSRIQPHTCVREGGSYLDDKSLTRLSSAAAVRHALAVGTSFPGLSVALPEDCLEVLKKDIGLYGITTENDYSLLLIDRLWKLGEPELLVHYQDVTEDLAHTIVKHRNLFTNFDEYAQRCCSKNLTLSHVYRAFLHIILDFREDPGLDRALYTQVLGFRRESEDLLALIREKAEIPVIVNPPQERETLPPDVRRLFDEEMRVSNLYESVRSQKSGVPFRNVLTKELVKV
ncbi:tRNA(Met) cytidine acetate ligase [Chordicoccus furentiruminis]|uniref:tRNA(Met) cytidine acetate ligase n=1 Tax=Chordicoccus furentiruminis TaxID=2709410 RepID=UPI0023A79134|nr:nucleotidyltransferase family protein [Chordicoccus furentiruminis]